MFQQLTTEEKKNVCVTNIVPDNTANTDNEVEMYFHYFTSDVEFVVIVPGKQI